MSLHKQIYNVGVPEYWQTVMPPLQHSLVGDAVMMNQFEPLVGRGTQGMLVPLAAKSWEFSQDKRILKFHIDTSRRFSDGSSLYAEDFKRSWEDGLRLQPKSSNSSLTDALANLNGFDQFRGKEGIAGIKVVSSDILELEFDKPVRNALEHLSGVRYAAYKIIDGKPVGTGPYVMAEENQVLTLRVNMYYAGKAPALQNVKIVAVPNKEALKKLQDGSIDAFLFAEVAGITGCSDGKLKQIKCAIGQEGTHLIVTLNGMSGRFFSDSLHRRAFQSLLLRRLAEPKNSWPQQLLVDGFFLDPQSFLKFQAGRLTESEAQAIIDKGAPHIQRFVQATQAHPLELSQHWDWLIDFLVSKGVKVGVPFEAKDRLSMTYKTFKPDILLMGASVSDADPDGLYHLLGRNGAIFSPMWERPGVTEGMESGRQLLDPAELPKHYQDVSRKILEEVPYVHVGYLSRSIAYNSEKFKISESVRSRSDDPGIRLFEPAE